MENLFSNPHIFDGIGVAGFILYVTSYTCLTLGFISGDSIGYFCMNLIAASCVMTGLMASFNLASALIQGFWITMSIIGITIRVMRPVNRAR